MSKKRDPEKVLAEFGRILRLGRVETVVRPGKRPDDPWRARIKGASGADYPVNEAHPLDYHLKVTEGRFKAELGKLRRLAELPDRQRQALNARAKAAEEKNRRVLELAASPPYVMKGAGKAGAIAVAVGLSPSQVRRILSAPKKNAHD